MLMTFAAIVLALIYFFIGPFPYADLSLTVPLTGALCFAVMLITMGLAIIPLQKTTRHISSYVVNRFRFDTSMAIAVFLVLLYALLSFTLRVEGNLILGWIIFLGIAMDATVYTVRRSLIFNDPHAILDQINNAPSQHWDVYTRLDALSEVAYKSFVDSNVALSESALEHIEELLQNYLEGEGKKEKQPGEHNYFLCHLFQHLDPLVHEAIAYRYDPIASKIVVLSGKVALHMANIQSDLVSLPLHYLGEYALKGIDQELPDIGVKGTVTLQTIAKEILKQDNLDQLNLREIYFSLIEHLDEIAKATFKKDKSINVLFLQDPFKDLIELFKADKLKNHPDTAVIHAELIRILAEYQTLESVMLSMPSSLALNKG